MQKIGFIGLGIMGKPMSKNILKSGYALTVFDLNQAAVQELVTCGATAAQSVATLASNCNVIITMLPNSPQVEEVVLQPGGLLENAAPGTIVIDMSSIAPLAAKRISEVCATKGIIMLDSPVSGGEPKAIEGTVSIMVGGDQAALEAVRPLLLTMGGSVVHCGDSGAGNTVKLANQIIVAINIAAVSEAMMLASKAGVNQQVVFEAIRGGLAGSTVLNAKAPMIIEQQFAPGFKVDLHTKDLTNVLETGQAVGSPLPLTTAVMEMLQALQSDGLGQLDHSAIYKYYEKLTDSFI